MPSEHPFPSEPVDNRPGRRDLGGTWCGEAAAGCPDTLPDLQRHLTSLVGATIEDALVGATIEDALVGAAWPPLFDATGRTEALGHPFEVITTCPRQCSVEQGSKVTER